MKRFQLHLICYSVLAKRIKYPVMAENHAGVSEGIFTSGAYHRSLHASDIIKRAVHSGLSHSAHVVAVISGSQRVGLKMREVINDEIHHLCLLVLEMREEMLCHKLHVCTLRYLPIYLCLGAIKI